MIDRKPGWYWVKWPHETKWCVAQYMGRVGERLMWSSGDIIQADAPGEIGPRIPTPDEPWQMVPVKLSEEMDEACEAEWLEVDDWNALYATMLKAAPKP